LFPGNQNRPGRSQLENKCKSDVTERTVMGIFDTCVIAI
jgi:hypothetical protein